MWGADEHELKATLSRAGSAADRIAHASGFIVARLRREGIDSVVVTGGAAVVLATARDFATLDIDLVTPNADRLDPVLQALGFSRRGSQHIWANERLRIAVQVPASDLPPLSVTDDIEAPTGDVVTIWSVADLMLDRLAQAVFWNANDRLAQALALRAAAGDALDLVRVRQRAAHEGAPMPEILDAFLRLFGSLSAEGEIDDPTYDELSARFWAEIDVLRDRR
ncbi:MAG TPA: hypothetical protein VNZ62_00540 [Capillimicrobium sp.]|jgi:hypothetical protein|nr:hypothetical protein [Capillimicrobium sp.]